MPIRNGCNDKPAGKFTYNGKEYKCSEIAIQYLDYNEKMYSYEYLQIGNETLSRVVDSFMVSWGGNVSDDFTEGIYENNQSVTGTNTMPNNSSSSSNNGSDNLFYFSIGEAFYFPRLTNAIGFANELSKAGEMDAISGDDKDSGTIKTVIDDMITEFSQVGTYILYAALIFFGVRTIWAGVEGRVDFKESLPYILLAIVFFYLAPDVVSFISEIVDHEFGEEYLPSIWASLVSIVQVAAFGGILFTGVKLIFSNASSRADAKQNLIPLLIGCILVFASSTVVSVILNTAKDAGLTSNNKNVNNVYYETTIDKV